MRVLTRYLCQETASTTALVLAGLLGLVALFDLIHELGDLGKGNYRLGGVFTYVLLSVPAHIYELLPVAALIGTVFALAQLASRSELTVMRVSGLSLAALARALLPMGLLFVALILLVGELVVPEAERKAQQLKLQATSTLVAQEFRSGLWVKDDKSFVNIQQIQPDATLLNLRIYQFDAAYRLTSISLAKRGEYTKNNQWRISQVEQTVFEGDRATLRHVSESTWQSVLTPEILSVLLVVPEQMSIANLYTFAEHLRENHQRATRYDIAIWSKLTYPAAVLVMMLLAVPFSATPIQRGGVGGRVFAGIMVGIGFHFLSRLFSHLGLLNEWVPLVSAGLPAFSFLLLALLLMYQAERR